MSRLNGREFHSALHALSQQIIPADYFSMKQGCLQWDYRLNLFTKRDEAILTGVLRLEQCCPERRRVETEDVVLSRHDAMLAIH